MNFFHKYIGQVTLSESMPHALWLTQQLNLQKVLEKKLPVYPDQ